MTDVYLTLDKDDPRVIFKLLLDKPIVITPAFAVALGSWPDVTWKNSLELAQAMTHLSVKLLDLESGQVRYDAFKFEEGVTVFFGVIGSLAQDIIITAEQRLELINSLNRFASHVTTVGNEKQVELELQPIPDNLQNLVADHVNAFLTDHGKKKITSPITLVLGEKPHQISGAFAPPPRDDKKKDPIRITARINGVAYVEREVTFRDLKNKTTVAVFDVDRWLMDLFNLIRGQSIHEVTLEYVPNVNGILNLELTSIGPSISEDPPPRPLQLIQI